MARYGWKQRSEMNRKGGISCSGPGREVKREMGRRENISQGRLDLLGREQSLRSEGGKG